MKNYTIIATVLIGLFIASHIIESPPLFALTIISGAALLLYSHLKKRFDKKTMTKLKLFVKFLTVITSLLIFYFFILQIGTLHTGSKQAGVMVLMWLFFIVLPYVILIIMIDSSENELMDAKLVWHLITIFSAFMFLGILAPPLGAIISFTVPLVVYIIIYTKHLDRPRSVALAMLFFYLLLAPYYFINGTDVGIKLSDPCFKREPYGKGEPFYIKNGHVCAHFKDGLTGNFATVEGADVETYKYLSNGCGYTKDKNKVYYHHYPTPADIATFYCENTSPSGKHTLCNNVICSDKNGAWEKGILIEKEILNKK
jgi:hypothetical protein